MIAGRYTYRNFPHGCCQQAMLVAEVMSRDVEFIEPSATAQAAAKLMGEIDVGALPVDTSAKVDGVVTDRDILYRVVARGLAPGRTVLRDILSRPVIGCLEGDTVRHAMHLMAANHVRRLPVRNTDGLVVGWVTLSDLARQLLVGNAAVQGALTELTEDTQPG